MWKFSDGSLLLNPHECAQRIWTQGPKSIFQKIYIYIYIERHFKTEKCFTENNISEVKRVLQVESQHPAYVCNCVTIT